MAILAYLGRKHDLDGVTEEEKINMSLLLEVARDLSHGLSRVAYAPNCEQLKPDYLKNVPVQLKQVAEFLKNHRFAAGSCLTYADFYIAEVLTKLRAFIPEQVGVHPEIQKYIEEIEDLDEIKKYSATQSPKPFNGPSATWNATY